MKKLLLGSVITAALFAIGAVQAADMPRRAPAPVYKAPAMVPPVFSWSGFYIGANVGYAWGKTTAFDTFPVFGACWAVCGSTFSANTSGFTGGGQLGYNWQMGAAVLGLEADVGYLGLRGSGIYSLTAGGLNPTFVNTSGGLFTTVRGRIGFLPTNNFLLYATGGYFGADFNSTITAPAVITNSTGFQSGWTAGAGGEYAFGGHWSVKAEYLYYAVPQRTVAFIQPPPAQPFGIKNTGNLVRTGFNYHF